MIFSFLPLVLLAPLPNNEECAHSYDIMYVWKIMSRASLRLIKTNNLSLARLQAERLPCLFFCKTTNRIWQIEGKYKWKFESYFRSNPKIYIGCYWDTTDSECWQKQRYFLKTHLITFYWCKVQFQIQSPNKFGIFVIVLAHKWELFLATGFETGKS